MQTARAERWRGLVQKAIDEAISDLELLAPRKFPGRRRDLYAALRGRSSRLETERRWAGFLHSFPRGGTEAARLLRRLRFGHLVKLADAQRVENQEALEATWPTKPKQKAVRVEKRAAVLQGRDLESYLVGHEEIARVHGGRFVYRLERRRIRELIPGRGRKPLWKRYGAGAGFDDYLVDLAKYVSAWTRDENGAQNEVAAATIASELAAWFYGVDRSLDAIRMDRRRS